MPTGSPTPTSAPVNQKINSHGQPISGYIAVHVLGLRVSPISTAPAVIDAVAGAAGDTLRLGSFSLSSPDLAAVRAEAATNAVTDARARAAALAAAAGVRLGPVLSIAEEPALDHGRFTGAVDLGLRNAGAHLPIHAGTDDITARLTITFRIEPDPAA